MIPSADDILGGYVFFARRYDLPPANERAVRAALQAAIALADDREEDEPAALLFAFATYRRAFPGAWRGMAGLLAKNCAHAQGRPIVVPAAEIDAFLGTIMYGETDYAQTRAWVAARR